MSQPYFRESKNVINQKVYLEDILKKKLVPFIRKQYADGNYVFWPDLTSSHYAKSVQEYLASENIQTVPKHLNPANVPQARVIENFWAILKRKVYEKGWKARTTTQLKCRITRCLKKIDPNLVQRLAEGTKRQLDNIRRNGV